MEFTLTYRGPLKANGGPVEKQAIRRAIHQQMRLLWQQSPLIGFTPSLLWADGAARVRPHPVHRVGDFRLLPLAMRSIDWTVVATVVQAARAIALVFVGAAQVMVYRRQEQIMRRQFLLLSPIPAEALREAGVSDFTAYVVQPGASLRLDLFLDEPS